MTGYYREHTPDSGASRAQGPAHRLGGTSEKESARLSFNNGRSVEKAARQTSEPGKGRALIGYVLGWLVGVTCLWALGVRLGDWAWGVSPAFCFGLGAVVSFFLGLFAAAIGVALTWSASGWDKLEPREFILRLVWRTTVCGMAIFFTCVLGFMVVMGLVGSAMS
jgi:hypothetical protein